MAKRQTIPISPAKLVADREIYSAVKAISGYAPANPTYALSALDAAHAKLEEAREKQTQAEAAAAAARDDAVSVAWEFHNLMLGVKDQVIAQFGKDSNEVQSVGLKRVSERKMPRRKAKPDTSST